MPPCGTPASKICNRHLGITEVSFQSCDSCGPGVLSRGKCPREQHYPTSNVSYSCLEGGLRYGKQCAAHFSAMGAMEYFKSAAILRARRQGSSTHALLPYTDNCAAGCDQLLRWDENWFPLHAHPNAYINFLASQRNPACRVPINSGSDMVGSSVGGAPGSSPCSATRRDSCLVDAWLVCREYRRGINRRCLHPLFRER